jgi:signal transduction histidine kinase
MQTDLLGRIKNGFQRFETWLLDLDVLEWALPIFLAVTAIAFELVEHIQKDELFDAGFIGELIIFGFMGPIIIRGLIVWMHSLMTAEKRTSVQLQALNRDLEKKVNERTAALEQRNAELDRLNRELRDLDEMKSDFVAMVSHELRAPLTALNGGLELALQSGEILSSRSRSVLEIMEQESRRLTDFVQTILDVSRLEAGKFALTLGPVAVRPLVEQASAVVLASSPRRVEWEFAADLPPIWGDETYLEQTIRNLISNADKYSPPNRPIHLCAALQGDRVRISVKDYGPGIPVEMTERVFSRFGRLQREESSPSGWGLGLYLARKLIEAQNGEIGFVSPIWRGDGSPKGVEFYIRMPVAQAPEDDPE